MLKTILITAVALTAPASLAHADIFGGIGQIENDVNQGMGEELNDIILTLPDNLPDLTCICYATCEVLAMIARGEFGSTAEEEAALAAAMLKDKSDGMISAVRNGGKLNMERMGKVTFKMKYARGFDGKATAMMLTRAGKAILK